MRSIAGSTVVRVALAAGVVALAVACADAPITEPNPVPVFEGNGTPPPPPPEPPQRVTVCKDDFAPSGTYYFTVSQEGGRAGILLVGPEFTLGPGECVEVWEASADPPAPDPSVMVTVSEVNLPANVVFDSLVMESERDGIVTSFDPTGTVEVNYFHEAVLTFYNTSTMAPGRMTGGGFQIKMGAGVKITRGLTIHCDLTLSNNIEVNWPGGNKWHIDKPLDVAYCIDDPDISPEPPPAPFDTFIGESDGELNGVPGSIIRFTFIDAGEPGDEDQAYIKIWAPGADPDVDPPVLDVGGFLDGGNLQAHFDQPHS